MKPIVIFGRGKLGRLIHYYITTDSKTSVAGFTVDKKYCTAQTFCDLPVVAFEEVETHFPPQDFDLILCVGYTKLKYYASITAFRKARFYQALKKGYHLPGYISSRTDSSPNVSFGSNVILIEKNIIQPYTTIGDNVLLFGNNLIGHDSVIEDHCYISAGVAVAGEVHIGESTFIGMNATITNNIRIGKECVIGAGSVISRSLREKAVCSPNQTELKTLSSCLLVKKLIE